MKRFTWALCCTLCIVQALGQQRITNKVIDEENGKPVAGATVEFENNATLITDENGGFQVNSKTSGQSVKITSVGYKPFETHTGFTAEPQVFRLSRYNLFLQPIEIHAVRAGEKAPFTKTNIAAKEIQQSNLGQDLPFLLSQTPSVVINSDAGNGVGYTGIRIRGTDATRINVTLNGIPYNDAESQGSYFVDVPDLASSVNSIQIQRGVGGSSNGAGAFGASINIATNEFREAAYGELNNSYGSFNTWKNTIKAGSGLLGGHFTLDARLSRLSSDGYIDRASSDLRSFYFSAAYISKKSSLRFNILSGQEKTYQAWNGILEQDLLKSRTSNSCGTEKPGTPYNNQTDNYQQDNYQLLFNHQFSENLAFNTAVFLTRGRGYYEEYKAKNAFSDYGLPDAVLGNDTIATTDLVRQRWLDNYFYGDILSFQYKKNNTQLTLGGGVNRYDGGHYGKVIWAELAIPKDYEYYNMDALKSDENVYVKWQQKLAPHIDGYLDLQYRNVYYNINGFENNPLLQVKNNYGFFNPKAGITYSNNNWNAYISYSIGNKEPNRDDFEANIKDQPRAETLRDLELSLEKRTAKSSFGATFYYMDYKNQLVLTGKINDVGAYTRTNIPQSYRTGVELQGGFKVISGVYASGNLTISSNKVLRFTEFVDDYDNGGQKINVYNKSDISFSPSLTGSAIVSITPVKNAEIRLIGKYVGRQYLDNTSNKTRSLGDYYVQDLRMMYTLKNRLFKETAIIFQVNNVFNRMYEPNGYTYSYISSGGLQTENYLFPMAGTNWMAGININL